MDNSKMYYELTETDIKNAVDYIPTAEKMSFVRLVAERCFDKLDITTNESGSDENRPLPSCYKINTDKKARYLMSALVGFYLGKSVDYDEDDDKLLMTVGEYDYYAGGHILEALNRMKNRADIRDKCYNILSDYGELKYRLESDIKGLLEAMNDSVSRILAYIEMASSPAEMERVMKEMTQNKELLDGYLEHRDENLEKAIAEEIEEEFDAEEDDGK